MPSGRQRAQIHVSEGAYHGEFSKESNIMRIISEYITAQHVSVCWLFSFIKH
jgi:hypothetical protein